MSKTLSDGQVCSTGLGDCGSTVDCNNRCQSSQPGGQGSCDSSINPQCICYYTCPPPPGPQQPCTAGYGTCGIKDCDRQCCDAKCKIKFPGPNTYGTCEDYIYMMGCLCHFLC
ncbi:hypothetical protein RND81_01G210200 [Saponaria officinalis]|uniref:Defensin-like protein n=1 Tax=Saponaria officinalis TaxID=3572 RepID=A0AAW1NHS9_SAPOF